MGRIGKVLSFLRVTKNGVNHSDVKVDMGGGANITAKHLSDSGDDSYPLDIDYVLLVSTRGQGKHVAIAYADTVNIPKANKGDKRIYSRDSSGVMAAEAWLKNDGEILFSNGSGTITLLPNGNIDLNGVVIDPSGNINSPGKVTGDIVEGTSSLLASTSEVIGHDHVIVSGSSAPGPTGPLI